MKNSDSILKEIEEYRDLPDDWDGDGAEVISNKAIGSARVFVIAYDGCLDFEPAPDPDGGVILEDRWAYGSVIIDFSPAGKVAYYMQVNGETSKGSNLSVCRFHLILDAFK